MANGKLRETSPAVGLTVDEFLRMTPGLKPIVQEFRRQKERGERPKPSTRLIDQSTLLTSQRRRDLLDKIASLVDENYVGRSEMCVQFAELLHRALSHLGLRSRFVMGTATYDDPSGNRFFEWDHAWVRVGKEVIDGNVDSVHENIAVPDEVRVDPYWGPINETPADRHLRERTMGTPGNDEDVEHLWWPDLREWLDQLPLDATQRSNDD